MTAECVGRALAVDKAIANFIRLFPYYTAMVCKRVNAHYQNNHISCHNVNHTDKMGLG